MTNINPLLMVDGYKLAHHLMYPEGTTLVYSNFTPRSNRHAKTDKVVSIGQQMFVQWLKQVFDDHFFKNREMVSRTLSLAEDGVEFSRAKELSKMTVKAEVVGEIKYEIETYLGTGFDCTHFEKLFDLGYLPIAIKALPEGVEVPMKIPVLTIYNTHPEFGWLVNYLETIISNSLWQVMTSASIALQYKKILTKWCKLTNPDALGFVDFQAHDFSMRGMNSLQGTQLSGFGHLAVFTGSDNLPAISVAREHYGATGFIIGGVPATEHSVMCAGTKDDEIGTFSRLMDIFPTGLLSVVSDTWDLWKVLTVILPALKEQILARDGKLVIRPDSGDPVDIICGKAIHDVTEECDKYIPDAIEYRFPKPLSKYMDELGGKDYGTCFLYKGQTLHYSFDDKSTYFLEGSNEEKGVIELLWDEFGGHINEQGYKVLDSHVGAIYGDSITLERAEEICKRLEAKGFASTNVVLGVGSYTYQMNTRDTYGFAMKATYVEVTHVEHDSSVDVFVEGRNIFKDPITDNGVKKSAKGLLQVYRVRGAHGYSDYQLKDQCSWEEESEGELQLIFEDGTLLNNVTLDQIRERLKVK